MSDTQKNKKPNVPNLRFPGFEGEWNVSSIGNEFELYSGNTPSRLDKNNFMGEINWITSGELKNHYIGDTKEKISENSAVINNLKLLPEGTFVIAIYGLEADGVRATGSITTKRSTISQACMAFIPKGKISNEFLYSWYKKHGNLIGIKYAQGTKQQNLSYDIIERLQIRYPSSQEQEKLNSFISLIDARISIQNKVIEKYESLIKALRYHIFSTIEPVKEVSFADVLSYEQPIKYIVSDTEYSDNKGLTPVLTANKAFILGYTKEVKGVYDKGPCIILDDFTLDSKIVDFPFKVKSSAIKILSAKTTVCLRYIFEYLKFLDLNNEEHKRHYIAEIEPMTIELPDEDTIQSIACLFDRIDQRRKGLERDVQLLKTQKEYLLKALFI